MKERLKLECLDLEHKIDKLQEYQDTPQVHQRQLIHLQLEGMIKYKEALQQRIHLLEKQEEENNGQ